MKSLTDWTGILILNGIPYAVQNIFKSMAAHRLHVDGSGHRPEVPIPVLLKCCGAIMRMYRLPTFFLDTFGSSE